MVKTIDNLIINTSVKPSYFDDGFTYMELIGMLTQKVIECINSCNLSEEKVNDILKQWNDIVSKTNDGKKVIDELIDLINRAGIYECSTQDIDNMFTNGTVNPNPNLATNQDIDELFK